MSDREALVHDLMNKEDFMNKELERGEWVIQWKKHGLKIQYI